VLFVVLLFALGLSTNLLGGDVVKVLWNPVLALVAWNLVAYVMIVVVGSALRLFTEDQAFGLASLGVSLAQRLRTAIVRTEAIRGPSPGEATASNVSMARIRGRVGFLTTWGRATAPQQLARMRSYLHLGAALLALGALCGMYTRGLVVDFKATWESTFLGADDTRQVLDILLGPALFATSQELPDLAEIEAPHTGPARLWIHLYAWTVLLIVLVPRVLMSAFEARRARRFASSVVLDSREPYFRRLLASTRGEASLALIVPYARGLDAAASDRLAGLLSDHLGSRAIVRRLEPVAYGTEPDQIAGLRAAEPGARRTLIVVFPLAQPPESEVHGRFLHDLRRHLTPDDTLTVLVDATGLREGNQAPERVEQRARAWDRVLDEEGVQGVHLDLGHLDEDDALARLADATA